MKAIKSAIILIVSGTILNVWLLRSGQQTPYRGSDASTLMEEFLAYGLSENIFYIVGFIKILAAILLLLGLFYNKDYNTFCYINCFYNGCCNIYAF
jgi:uncharacterized membrane protein YphA (DoxX/SURF4 family)